MIPCRFVGDVRLDKMNCYLNKSIVEGWLSSAQRGAGEEASKSEGLECAADEP